MALGCLILLSTTAVLAQEESAEEPAEEPARRWENTAELALVQTAGNSESFTFSLRDTFVWNWDRASLTSELFALRAESATRVLSNEAGEVMETFDSEVTGEQFSLSSKYNREISERTGWYTDVLADRNPLAGFDRRFAVGAGVSHLFVDSEARRFRGEAGLGYLTETPIEDAGPSEDFLFGRLFGEYKRSITETSDFRTELELMSSLDNTDDHYVNFLVAVTARISAKLALKMSYTMAYRGEPVVVTVPGETPDVPDGEFEFDSLDTILSTSLVIAF
jgi:putative salt-induced outer membrane protein YdiY